MTDKVKIKAIIKQYADKGERLLEEAYKNGIYKHTNGYSSKIFEDEWRMWDIAKDAKVGDVLHCWIDGDEFVLIYKGIKDGYITTYAHLYQKLKSFSEEPTSMFCRTIQGHFIPATKEQRDLLFKKMKEAGYEWDAEKKELKKIEQKLVSSDCDRAFKDFVKRWNEEGADPHIKDVESTFSEKIMALIKENKALKEQQAEWSEEDKDFMYDTLSNLTELKDRYGEGYGKVGKCIDWLKSLRPQKTWKPSKEQMRALGVATNISNVPEKEYIELEKLYQDLQKLMEE